MGAAENFLNYVEGVMQKISRGKGRDGGDCNSVR